MTKIIHSTTQSGAIATDRSGVALRVRIHVPSRRCLLPADQLAQACDFFARPLAPAATTTARAEGEFETVQRTDILGYLERRRQAGGGTDVSAVFE